MKIKVGLIGFGRMGRFYLTEFQRSSCYDVAYICDLKEENRELAHQLSPDSTITDSVDVIFNDNSIQLVVLCALANSRKEQIEKARQTGKHIISEKPIADSIQREWEVVDMLHDYDKFYTVNLYLRNSWYHNAIKDFIEEGEIGELAIFITAFVGATLGFLWYNSHPAEIFMGDTGSLAIGGIIAVFALLIRKELLIPIMCGIFLMESLSVIIQTTHFKRTKKKYGEGRRVFLMAPLHHHYQKKGIKEEKIVMRFYLIGILLAVISIVTLKLR